MKILPPKMKVEDEDIMDNGLRQHSSALVCVEKDLVKREIPVFTHGVVGGSKYRFNDIL